MSASLHALTLPEILDLICVQIDERADLVRLAQTSHRLFSSSMPYVWGEYVFFDNLLRLLPGALRTDDEGGKIINISVLSRNTIFSLDTH
jgi:hypothetical protein